METSTFFFPKRTCLFFLSILAFSFSLSAQTEISGEINSDSTLNLAGSPYLVPYGLVVNPGVTLTVEQGVELKFGNYARLQVLGTLQAQGAVFTSNAATPEPGSWNGIITGNDSHAGTVNLTDCEVKFYHECVVVRGQMNATNINFSGTDAHGIIVAGSGSLQLNNGIIQTSTDNSFYYCSGIFSEAMSTVTISGTTIQHFRNGVSSYRTNISLTDIEIRDTYYPVELRGINNFLMTGNNKLDFNAYKAVVMGFNELNDTLILPQIQYPYLFREYFNIKETGKLIVDPGNVLKFDDYVSMSIKGILIADGNESENIIFTSLRDDNAKGDTNGDGTITAPETGSWYGINFENESVDTENLLQNCIIRYGGRDYRGGVNTYHASPTIDSCSFANNYYGIYLSGVSKPVISNTTIGSSSMTPLAMSFEADPVLTNNVLSFSDNAYDAIGIIGGHMSANGTLKVRSFTDVPNITYYLLNEIIVPENVTLTINKGITLKSFRHDGGWDKRIIVYGNLIADATAGEMINFTSARDDNYGYPADCNKDGTMTSPVINDWGGIIFQPGSSGLLNYCRFKYAEINNFSYPNCNQHDNANYSAIAIIDAGPVITNCEFKDLHHAISCYRAADPQIDNCQMINITYTPLNISGTSTPSMSNIQFTNVGWRAIGLIGGNVCLNGTIQQRNMAGFNNISYILLNDMVINEGSYINIDPGVVIKLAGSDNYYGNFSYGMYGQHIFVKGGLKANGAADNNVIITSVKDDNVGNPLDTNGDGNGSSPQPGNWSYIKYLSEADDAFNTLNYTQLKFGGEEEQGMLHFENSGGKVNNSILINSKSYGVLCNGNANPVFDGVTIQNSNSDPIALSLTANPSFTNMQFISNFSNALKIIDRELNGNAVLASRNIAGIQNIAYIIDNLKINSSGKLTINPGVVIKFRTSNSYILSEGNLIAKGTPEQKIYLTSFKDDSKGGDSNNNGNADAPEKGNWGGGQMHWYGYWIFPPSGIYFRNNTQISDTVNVLDHCEIRYCDTGIRVENAHATINNTTVQLCSYFGTTVIGNSNPVFNNCQFYNLNYSPVELSMFSEPEFNNCSALNVGFMALAVIPETYSLSDTIPIRSFGGYDNITYLTEGPSTINTGTTITIPEGVVFKSRENITSGGYYYSPSYMMANAFTVNGRLNIQGSAEKPVVFTHLTDDRFGNPFDTELNGSASMPEENPDVWSGTWVHFSDVSDDLSLINHAKFHYGEKGISNLSASPVIRNSSFEKLKFGVDMSGVSMPAIDSCIFHNLRHFPIQISLVAYPASTKDNIISGTTYKVIKVRDEILTQDITLPKRNFGGKNNIPYYFEKYEIGTSASLEINPGVICKFGEQYWWQENGLYVNRGLKAIGGSTPDSIIVFTSITDDFYGGDSNADGHGGQIRWGGIRFADLSLDPLCELKNCYIRFADKGISTYSSSPTIRNSNFNNNNYGIFLQGASNPLINNTDFSSNVYYGIKNEDKSFNVNATECWWGNNNGPIVTDDEEQNENEQELITSGVNYIPWKNLGAINPAMGDVSLNGFIQAYDASLILKHTVELISLNESQQQVADVSYNGEISALDASLVLQHVVGLESTFPVHKVKRANVETGSQPSIVAESMNIPENENEIEIPVHLYVPAKKLSSDIEIRFNPAHIRLNNIGKKISNVSIESNFDNLLGKATIGIASATGFEGSLTPVSLHFDIIPETSTVSQVSFSKFKLDEQDYLAMAQSGIITITRINSGTNDVDIQAPGIRSLYPNPVINTSLLIYTTEKESYVELNLYNLMGQKVKSLLSTTLPAGNHNLQIRSDNLENGTYILKMRTDDNSYTQKVQIRK